MPRLRTVIAQNQSVLLRALNETGLSPVGRAIGRDHTYVSRFRDNQQGMKLDDLLTLLETCGLKLIQADNSMVVVDRADYLSLLNMANKGMRQLNTEARERWGLEG